MDWPVAVRNGLVHGEHHLEEDGKQTQAKRLGRTTFCSFRNERLEEREREYGRS